MKIAIVSEEYDSDSVWRDGGLVNVREAVSLLYPDACLIRERRSPTVASFRQAWRVAMRMEEIDLGGFDLVITLSAGFAHGVIPGFRTKHLAYCFAYSGMNTARGLRGHWYRFWSGSTAFHIDRWLTSSTKLCQMLMRNRHGNAKTIYPPVSINIDHTEFLSSPLPRFPFSPETAYAVLLPGRYGLSEHQAVVDACNKAEMELVIISSDTGNGRNLERERWVNEVVAPSRAARRVVLGSAAFAIAIEQEIFPAAAAEALVLQKPVLALRGSAAEEVVREGETGLFFDDLHPGVIGDGLRRMRERQKYFSEASFQKASLQFSAERFRREFQEAVTETLEL